MTDKEVFEKFMSWMGMTPILTKEHDGNTIIVFDDKGDRGNDVFSKVGHDEFYSGIEFDKRGKIVKAYMDSHVAYASKNRILIHQITNNK